MEICPSFWPPELMKGPLIFFKGNDLFCPLSFDELSHWHFPSSPDQDPILNFFPELSGTSTYTISADVDGVGVGELEKILLRGMF